MLHGAKLSEMLNYKSHHLFQEGVVCRSFRLALNVFWGGGSHYLVRGLHIEQHCHLVAASVYCRQDRESCLKGQRVDFFKGQVHFKTSELIPKYQQRN